MGKILSTNAINIYSPYRPTLSVASPKLNREQTLADEGDILAYLVFRPVSPSVSGSDF